MVTVSIAATQQFRVSCRDDGSKRPLAQSYHNLLSIIPVGQASSVLFGGVDRKDVDVTLPGSIYSSKSSIQCRCAFLVRSKFILSIADRRVVFTLSSTGPPDVEVWLTFYWAAVAVDALCVRDGRWGIAIGLGMDFDHDWIILILASKVVISTSQFPSRKMGGSMPYLTCLTRR